MGGRVLRVRWHRALNLDALGDHQLVLLLDELLVQADLIQGEEPLLLDIVRVAEESEHPLVRLNLKHVDPTVARFLRRSKLYGTVLTPALAGAIGF